MDLDLMSTACEFVCLCCQISEAAAAPADDDNVFWSVSQMMLRAATSQHSVDESAAPPDDKHNKHDELSNSVSVRVPPSTLTGPATCWPIAYS